MAKLKEAPTIEDLEAKRAALALEVEDGDQDALEELRKVEVELIGRRVDSERRDAAQRERERREAEKAAEEERRKKERLTRRRKKAARERRKLAEQAQEHLDALVDAFVALDEQSIDAHNETASDVFNRALVETIRRRCVDTVTGRTLRRQLGNQGPATRRTLVEWEHARTEKWLRGRS